MERVQSYFQKTSHGFDAIYSSQKSLQQKIVDFLFHRVVQQRFGVAFQEIGELKGKKLIDVGCGSGRYLLEAARRGASRVTGVDFADSMLELARRYLEAENFTNIAGLFKQDFLQFPENEQYEYLLAIGFFDYIPNPVDYLKKMKRLVTERLILSFPKKWTVRTPLRWSRLTLAGCPVFFYQKRKVENLLKSVSFHSYKLINLSRDYLAIIDLKN